MIRLGRGAYGYERALVRAGLGPVAGADEDRVRIHVTWRQDWPVVFTAPVTSRSTIPAALTCR